MRNFKNWPFCPFLIPRAWNVTYSILYQLHSVFPGKKKSGSGGRHKWTDEQLTELKRTFSFAKKNKKLPKLKEVEALVQMCPNVNMLFKQKRVTISAIKNKIDRIFNITRTFSWKNSVLQRCILIYFYAIKNDIKTWIKIPSVHRFFLFTLFVSHLNHFHRLESECLDVEYWSEWNLKR